MARPLRIEYDGAWYHVMNRGLERRKIYLADRDHERFLELLREITQIYSIQIHAFSLMPNHYHLLIHTPVAGLSRAMRHLNGIYTQDFNKKYRRDGPLFRGRYKATLVDTEAYLTALVRYIHLNPVVAKICQQPKSHKWTSHKYYLKDVKGYEWLYTREVLTEYGRSLKDARQKFDVMLRSKLNEDLIKEIEHPSHGILGSDFFKQWANANFVEDNTRKDREIAKRDKELKPKVKTKQLLANIGMCYDMKISEIRSTKTGQRNEARSLAIYLMRHQMGYSLKQIAGWLKTSNEYTIAQSLRRFKVEMENDRRLQKRVIGIERAVLK